MTATLTPFSQDVRRVLLDAAGLCTGTEDADLLRRLAGTLGEPLRVALAGLVKAGKSTLLNALLSERVAATDAAECTRMITSYEYGPDATASAQLHDGSWRDLEVTTPGGSVSINTRDLAADDVSRIVVRLPHPHLSELTVIDTPGIASLSTDVSRRTEDFLRPQTVDQPADAVIFLMRRVHESDVNFLEAFHNNPLVHATPVNAIGVLSRADEIVPGRVDSLDVAAILAQRYRREPRLRTLVQTVLPISGLLAETGATLTDDEFDALARIADLPAEDVAERTMYVDGFLRHDPSFEVSFERRRRLLRRLGLFGLRLSLSLLASGDVTDRAELSGRLVEVSGVAELRRVLTSQFTERAALLKAQTALRSLEAVLPRLRRADAERLRLELERVTASAHGFAELRLLNAVRVGDVPMGDDERERVEALLGAEGGSVRRRLRLVDEASDQEVRDALRRQLDTWRRTAENPLAEPSMKRAAQTLRRTCEGLRLWHHAIDETELDGLHKDLMAKD